MEIDSKTECGILDTLDAMEQDAWLALVRYMAPKVASDRPTFLLEMLIRRGQIIARRMSVGPEGLAERIALTAADVGVKLVVA